MCLRSHFGGGGGGCTYPIFSVFLLQSPRTPDESNWLHFQPTQCWDARYGRNVVLSSEFKYNHWSVSPFPFPQDSLSLARHFQSTTSTSSTQVFSYIVYVCVLSLSAPHLPCVQLVLLSLSLVISCYQPTPAFDMHCQCVSSCLLALSRTNSCVCRCVCGLTLRCFPSSISLSLPVLSRLPSPRSLPAHHRGVCVLCVIVHKLILMPVSSPTLSPTRSSSH